MKFLYPLVLCLFMTVPGTAQIECPDNQVCLESNAEFIIALGVLRVEDKTQSVVLEGDKRGTMRLVLSPSLQKAVRESPAESYEAEGYLSRSRGENVLVVTNLRPIE